MTRFVELNDCIEWTGARTSNGYGHRTIKNRQFLVHRLAWEAANGPIPDGLCVLHRCDNRPCINVEHLFLGTRLDNNRDMIAKGRQRHRSLTGDAHPNSKVTEHQAAEIRTSYGFGITQAALALRYGISPSAIGQIVRHETHNTSEHQP